MYVSNSLDVVILPTMALLAAASFRILPALGVLQMCLVNFKFATPIIDTTYNCCQIGILVMKRFN